MNSFNFETLNSGKNSALYTSFIKFDFATATVKDLLNMALFEEHLNNTVIEKVG